MSISRSSPARRRLNLWPLVLTVAAFAIGAAIVAGALPSGSSEPASDVSPARPRTQAREAQAPAPSKATPARTTAAQGGVYAATTSAAGLRPFLANLPPRVYVPNTLSNSVDVLDARTGRRIRRIAVGALPHHVAPSWDQRSLFVDNTNGNSLTQIDVLTGRVMRTIPITDPYNLYFTPDGRSAIVVAERFQRLDFRDPRTWRLQGSVSLPGSGGDHLDFSADGRSLLISDEFSGHVVRVDVTRRRVTAFVPVGGLPVDVKLAPDGRRYFVANQGTNGVDILDARTLRKLRFVRTAAGAHGLAISRDARTLFVSNRIAGSITRLDAQTGRSRGTWTTGGSPDMLQVSTDGRELWVSDRYSTTVSVYDTRTGSLRRRIQVGSQPHGLALFPQPGRYSLGHNGVYR